MNRFQSRNGSPPVNPTVTVSAAINGRRALISLMIHELLPVRWTPSLACHGDPLELIRAEIADGRVASLWVVEALDVIEHVGAGFVARSYPPGEGRLAGLMVPGDLVGVRTSAVKIRDGLLDGDHHRR